MRYISLLLLLGLFSLPIGCDSPGDIVEKQLKRKIDNDLSDDAENEVDKLRDDLEHHNGKKHRDSKKNKKHVDADSESESDDDGLVDDIGKLFRKHRDKLRSYASFYAAVRNRLRGRKIPSREKALEIIEASFTSYELTHGEIDGLADLIDSRIDRYTSSQEKWEDGGQEKTAEEFGYISDACLENAR